MLWEGGNAGLAGVNKPSPPPHPLPVIPRLAE